MRSLLFVLLICLYSCKNESSVTKQEILEDYTSTEKSGSQLRSELEVYDYDGLEPLINKTDDKVHIVNFWATWCAPCIKELPYFEAITNKYSNDEVEVLLVSLDFPSKYESALIPFIKKKNIRSKVVAFDDTNQNRWIPAIHKTWSGAIPATIIYKGNQRKFYEKSFTQNELETELKHFLN